MRTSQVYSLKSFEKCSHLCDPHPSQNVKHFITRKLVDIPFYLSKWPSFPTPCHICSDLYQEGRIQNKTKLKFTTHQQSLLNLPATFDTIDHFFCNTPHLGLTFEAWYSLIISLTCLVATSRSSLLSSHHPNL